ncbi:ABC transporter substrate-binding protein [Bradyrhizobium manausense]|uniref:ABC transporter substrate-binding protein n=1 Tax=Bradyrhizobium manausense TaxID=989370 RepID=UPI001BA44E96|nr:ABC transporter substrate-binding protein [Bradyrhizobium manausense]MBR0687792.1 ABC transporter substrate-binding protein [Bradyrhizobium manausense]
MLTRRDLLISGAAAATLPRFAHAQGSKPLKIGVMNDMSGPYADHQGIGSVLCAQMAADDFAAKAEVPVEIISADHQNKPDVGLNIARRWFDTENVDVILDVPNSAVVLAISNLTREKNKILIGSGAGSSVLTGAQCSPNFIHWTYDTWSLGHSLGRALTSEGGKTWFFITADYAFGKDLEKNAAEAVEASGGKVLGAVRHPINTSDFSSFLLQAQASGADVIALANAGDDASNCLKQATEFGIEKKQRLAGLIMNVTNAPAIGIKSMANIKIVVSFYWAMNDDTRAFGRRYQAAHPRKWLPNDQQAGNYSAVQHLIKAMAKTKSAVDGRALIQTMKSMPTDDIIFGKGSIREDGRKLHPTYLLSAKTPEETSDEWDGFKVVRTIPVEEAWRPLAEGGCPFVKG